MKQFLVIFLELLFLAPLTGHADQWSPELADRLAQLSIRCVEKESPHYYERMESKYTSREMHPVFFGCYDWHSAVHGHWAMLRALRAYPNLSSRDVILSLLDRQLTVESIQGELKHFEKFPDFERPYGWAWLLRLAAEISNSNIPNAEKWGKALVPLEKLIRDKMLKFTGILPVPFREGWHVNSAYAFMHGFDYARKKKDKDLENAIRAAALRLYSGDRICPLAYEPSAGDFLSPCFAEAAIMARVMPKKKFRQWWGRFLPKIDSKQLEPVVPLDPKDPILGHLIGLMFFKSWAMEEVAEKFPKSDKTARMLRDAAKKQTETALKMMFDSGYGGEHWLASFAVFRFTE